MIDNEREKIATRIHQKYHPNDENCSFMNTDWEIAKEIAELKAENKEIKNFLCKKFSDAEFCEQSDD